MADKKEGVEHEKGKEWQLAEGDDPNSLDLQEGQGAAGDEHANLVAKVENDVGVSIDEAILLIRVQINDLMGTGYCEGSCNCVL